MRTFKSTVHFHELIQILLTTGYQKKSQSELLTCRELASVSPGLAMAARMAVVVVPMFEPRDSGYALSMLMTPIPN